MQICVDGSFGKLQQSWFCKCVHSAWQVAATRQCGYSSVKVHISGRLRCTVSRSSSRPAALACVIPQVAGQCDIRRAHFSGCTCLSCSTSGGSQDTNFRGVGVFSARRPGEGG
ncbi:unnamed protein product, partial [Amoebophrya sp. A25]